MKLNFNLTLSAPLSVLFILIALFYFSSLSLIFPAHSSAPDSPNFISTVHNNPSDSLEKSYQQKNAKKINDKKETQGNDQPEYWNQYFREKEKEYHRLRAELKKMPIVYRLRRNLEMVPFFIGKKH